MNTLKSLILIAQTITTFANAHDISACMANIKQENAAAKWQCGKVGKVEYYCIGNNDCIKKTKKCGLEKEKLSDLKYSPQSYKAIEAKCQASAKKGAAAAEAKLRKADSDKIKTKCMKNIQTTWQHKTQGSCGKVNGVSYFCTDQQQCSSFNFCGGTAQHINTAQKEYSPDTYQSIKEDCDAQADSESGDAAEERAEVSKAAEAKAKKIADCKSKIMTEDNDAHRYRCGLYGGVAHYCIANNYCSTGGWCAQTALHKQNAQTKYSPSAYEKELKKCEASARRLSQYSKA